MRGSELEALVRHSADKAKDAGLSLIQTGPRFVGRVTGKAGQAQGRLVGVGGLDFIGDFRGRSVSFDCKSVATPTRFDLSNIRPHQVTIIRRAHERGALAFLLVEFRQPEPAAYYALDWLALRPWWQPWYLMGNGPASIPRAVIEAECTPIARTGKTLAIVEALGALTG